MNKDTFCILPWMHLATNAGGNLRVCCNSTPGKNFITKEDGTPYKLFKDDLREAWNSEVYDTIRKQMLNGERPDMCQRCFREEDVGIRSARQAWNSKWAEDKEYTSVTPFNIKYVDLRLGNLCNLKCRMCNPYASNQWVKEWSLVEETLNEEENIRLSNMTWPKDEKTWENLYSIADTVEEIYLTGGEPTIIHEQHKLLDYFIERGTAKNIRLKYNTNLTNVPKHLLDKWSKFKRVQLNCSIDAVGDLDRYIRYPSNWDTIVRNFETVRQLPNANIEIHCTVQMYNILRLEELIKWAEPYGHKIYFNILNHPDYLNIRCLPKSLKIQAQIALCRYKHLDKVQGIIDYMNAEDWSNKLHQFNNYTNILDTSRDQNLKKIVPELVKEVNYVLEKNC
jgi:MoaA/NifB/PqqE/SkfB family radical SAM enzyme